MAKKQTNGSLALEQPCVIVIPAHDEIVARKLRVAAYARFSSGKDAMLHSLSAQVSYYNGLIQSHAGWLYRGVYSDAAVIIGLKTLRLKKCRKRGAF